MKKTITLTMIFLIEFSTFLIVPNVNASTQQSEETDLLNRPDDPSIADLIKFVTSQKSCTKAWYNDTEHSTKTFNTQGHFRTVGDDDVPDDLGNDLDNTAEQLWNLYHNTYRFREPPDSQIELQITNLDSDTEGWGITGWSISLFGEHIITIKIDFKNYDNVIYDRNIIKAILAHEVFHAVQAAYHDNDVNAWANAHDWIIEGTADLMMDIVYDDVNAYVIGGHMGLWLFPDAVDLTQGSYLAQLYWKYLYEQHGGVQRILDIFEQIAPPNNRRSIEAVDTALRNSINLTFEHSFIEFAKNHYTKNFEEANLWWIKRWSATLNITQYQQISDADPWPFEDAELFWEGSVICPITAASVSERPQYDRRQTPIQNIEKGTLYQGGPVITWNILQFSIYRSEQMLSLSITAWDDDPWPLPDDVLAFTGLSFSLETGTYIGHVSSNNFWFDYNLTVRFVGTLSSPILQWEHTWRGEDIETRQFDVNTWAYDFINITSESSDPLKIYFEGNLQTNFLAAKVIAITDRTLVQNDVNFYPGTKRGVFGVIHPQTYDRIALVIIRGSTGGTGNYSIRLSSPIGEGLAWLKTRQNDDGSWTYVGRVGSWKSVGVTALAALAFINNGTPVTDPVVNKALSYIISMRNSDGSFSSLDSWYKTYETSMAILALVAAKRAGYSPSGIDVNQIIKDAMNYLLNAQCIEKNGYPTTDRYFGGWGYIEPTAHHWADLSNTQWAVIALDAAEAHLNIDPRTDTTHYKAWLNVTTFTVRCHNNRTLNSDYTLYHDGGFIYQPASTIWAGGRSYGSMTAAGVWVLQLSKSAGITSTPIKLGMQVSIDEVIKNGLRWLEDNYHVDQNYPIGGTYVYYYLLTVAKAWTMTGVRVVNSHEWYKDMTDYLVNHQSSDGHWPSTFWEEPDTLATVESILALQVRVVPAPVARLSYLTFILRSNADLHIYDPSGRHVGLNYQTGQIEIQIPGATFSYTDGQVVTVPQPMAGDYKIELIGRSTGSYELTIEATSDTTTFFSRTFSGSVVVGEAYESVATVTAVVGPITIYVSPPTFSHIFDVIPPTTTLSIGKPRYMEANKTYVTSATSFTLIATDNPSGTGVNMTAYRIYNASYDTGWLEYTTPFYLTRLVDGAYNIDYNSTDNIGNVEPTNTATVILDNTGPLVTIVNPPSGWALQDGVTFIASAIDSRSGVASLNFSIREANGTEGISIGFEDLPATYNATTGKWTLFFDTLLLPDGYYVVLARAKDNLGNIGPSSIVPYSIRNWAVIELLPASENNKAGRTMPVKFALRVVAEVDPLQPFVYNEELVIKIYATSDPSVILQESRFGDTARDYRINTISEHYITNFKTLTTPMEYTVTVYRDNFEIGGFTFKTVK